MTYFSSIEYKVASYTTPFQNRKRQMFLIVISEFTLSGFKICVSTSFLGRETVLGDTSGVQWN